MSTFSCSSKETTTSAMSRLQSSNVSVSLSSSSSVSPCSSSFRSSSAPSDEYNLSTPTSPGHHHNQLFSPVSTKANVPFSWEHLPGIPKNINITNTTPPPPVVATKPTGHRRHPKSQSPSNSSSSSSSSSSFTSLPLPPSSRSNHDQKDGKKQSNSSRSVTLTSGSEVDVVMSRSRISWQDPFFAALMECSKDANETSADHDDTPKVGRSVGRSRSDRFSIVNLFTSLDQFSCKRSCGVLSEYVVVQKGYVRHR